MQLLTDADRAALPDLYATEGQGDAAVCRVRFMLPGTYWEWLVVELSRADGDVCFGLIAGRDVEIGYFSLSELEQVGAVLRDTLWSPCSLATAWARIDARRMTGRLDFTDHEPGDVDLSGGTFERCPVCGRVGRMVEYVNGGRTYVHVMSATPTGYLPDDRCYVPPGDSIAGLVAQGD